MKTAVIIVGHGSRDPESNAEFEELVSLYQKRRPDLRVGRGYIELARPPLAFALAEAAQTADHIVVVPLMLFASGHVKNDIPLALASARNRTPHVRFEASPALGIHPALVSLAAERAATLFASDEEKKKTAVIMVGRGSSDPDANGDFFKVTRLFEEGRGILWAMPSFIGITRPLFEETLEMAARARPERLVVLPYLLFGGRLMDKIQEQSRVFVQRYPWIKTQVAPYLGAHEKLLDVIDERVRGVWEGQVPLPCDACQYRVPLSGFSENVGGLKALLWSVRHTFTHNQAAPHAHAHKGLRKHVFVCGNVDCADKGSVSLLETMRRLLKDLGREKDVRVTKTSCMGRCGEGPTVAVYPDGIWYRGVRPEDADELVKEHLLQDKLVARLVDNILQ